MSTTYDRRNTLVVTAGGLIFGITLVTAGVLGHDRAEDLRTERQITERVRVEACGSIEDEEIRALCILGTREADR